MARQQDWTDLAITVCVGCAWGLIAFAIMNPLVLV